jgi:hypothetical protein
VKQIIKRVLKRLSIKKNLDLKNPEVRKMAIGHLGKVALATLSVVFLLPAGAIEPNATTTTVVVNQEASKTVIAEALKIMRSKPGLSVAAVITCCSCIPIAGLAAY